MDVASRLIDQYADVLGLLVLLCLFIGFIVERFPPVVVAVAGAASMLLLGFLSAGRLEAVFSNPAPITIGAMFVLSGALVRTGVVEALAGYVSGRAEQRPLLSIGELLGGTFFASALVNNTPVVVVLIPIVKRIAAAVGTSARRLLIPLSYISILGGSLTLIGTSTNLLVDGVAQRAGEAAFGIFEVTPIGLVAAATGGLTLLILGKWLLPADDEAADVEAHEKRYVADLQVPDDSELIGSDPVHWNALRRSGVDLIGLRRGNTYLRGNQLPERLRVGDILIVSATETELLSLSAEPGLVMGVGRTAKMAANADDVMMAEAAISPAHPAIGRRLAEIPFLARLDVRVIGIARARHLAGPSLAEARLRAGDRLMIRGNANAMTALQQNVNLVDVGESQSRSFRRLKAPIVIVTMLGVIALAAFGVTTIETLAIMGVAVVLLTRCIDAEEAWQSIDGNVLVLIFAMLAVGVGLQNAGTVDLLVSWVAPLLAVAPPFLTLLIIYALTSVLTEIVTNNAVAVLMTPIVLGLAAQLGVDARPFLLAVMFAASASFATPIGYQTNTLIYAAGGYRFVDFLRIGVPMNVSVGLATCTAIYFMV